MSVALFSSMFKRNSMILLLCTIWLVLYLLAIIAMYNPADVAASMAALKSMPASMQKAFGLSNMITTLNDFLANVFYSISYGIILIVYAVLVSTRLIATHVSRGSMSYLLSTPVSRSRVAITQAIVFGAGLLALGLFTVLTGLLGSNMLIANAHLDTGTFLAINLIGFLLYFFVGGYCFFFSCLFNDDKIAFTVSAVVTLSMFALNMIAKVGEVGWIHYFTVFSLFNPTAIARGEVVVLPLALLLAVMGGLFYGAGIVVFTKRDLPL